MDQKKKISGEIETLKAQLISNLKKDRDNLSNYVTVLLEKTTDAEDPYAFIAAAEPLAKLSDSLTKQNSLLLAALNSVIKREKGEAPDDDDIDLNDEIGRPFINSEKIDGN